MEALKTPMANRAADRWSPGIALSSGVSGPMAAVVDLFAMSADAVRFVLGKPFQWREFWSRRGLWRGCRWRRRCWWRFRSRCWCLHAEHFVAGARRGGSSGRGGVWCGDPGGSSGDGVDRGGCRRDGDVCGFGSRTIREEIDAMEVLGINPVQRLVTLRMLASGLVALLLNPLVVTTAPRCSSRCELVCGGDHLC